MSPALGRAWRMAPDNFTPPSRTPWGGRAILDRFKRGLDLDPERAAYSVVGESWEVSVEPSFPSQIMNLPDRPRLEDAIATDPVGALGEPVARRDGGCPLLVKLLDAAHPLSVQVHPSDDHVGLAPTESGKPESWLILAAAPGAGLYLGFREGVGPTDVAEILRAGEDLTPLLNFVPVAPGDCFELAPGAAHAIGAGVTLVEPQIVRPGKVGVTYRFWDWNRRYDAAGVLDPRGTARALHVAESLAVTDFEGPQGEALVARLRRHPERVEAGAGARRERLIAGPLLLVERWSGTGGVCAESPSLLACVVVSGSVQVGMGASTERFATGESFVLPHALLPTEVLLESAEVVASAPTP